MSKRENRELVLDILEAIEKIFRYTEGMSYESFSADEKTIDAVVRNVEIMGEAANRIEKELREKYPLVEWRKIIGLRNRIVHKYFGIDIEIIWTIIQENLNLFRRELQEMKKEL